MLIHPDADNIAMSDAFTKDAHARDEQRCALWRVFYVRMREERARHKYEVTP